MRVRSLAILVLTAAASFGVPAFAHHSQSMFDTTKEILVEGKVAKFDWKNPHMYLIVETKGPKPPTSRTPPASAGTCRRVRASTRSNG